MKNALRREIALLLALLLLGASSASAATKYATLEFGSRGTAVKRMQTALITLGFDPGGTDGKFGRGTESAVMAYQLSRGIESDGKAGTQTLNLLYSELGSATATTATTAVATSPDTLKKGDSGARVTQLQTALQSLGYYSNSIDGSFGSGTHKAVVAFQKANRLTADGLAGTKTLALLYSLANSGNSSSASSGASATITTDSTGFTRTLRRGYAGNDVVLVQTRLKALGYYANTIDGSYGAGTMSAVSAFQQRNNLTVDGLTGSLTYAAIFSSDAIAAATETTVTETTTPTTTTDTTTGYALLSSGSTGDAVTKLQQALSALGYSVSVTGSYDSQTVAAVQKFQSLNSLSSDGVAGSATQTKLYGGSAVQYTESAGTTPAADGVGAANGPSASEVKLLHWYNEVKPAIRTGQTLTIFDPATNLQWSLRLYSLGHHADSEPKTLTDTQIMYKAFGNTNTWTPKAVYVKLPSGTWTLASMHNVPHLSGSISDNGFDGHLCVHFFRDMEECKANDPNYGVTHQNAIRKKWKQLTGVEITD